MAEHTEYIKDLNVSQDSTCDTKLLDELSCPICLEVFQSPVQLPCLHNFCQDCLQAKLEYNQARINDTLTSVPFDCPTCRLTVTLSESGIDNLPKNFTLSNIVSEYKKMHNKRRKRTVHDLPEVKIGVEVEKTVGDHTQTCIEHRKVLTLYCCACDSVMCTKCVAKHKTHEFEDIEDRSEKCLLELQSELIPRLSENRNCLMTSQRETHAAIQNLKKRSAASWQLVSDEIQTLKDLLHQKEKQLEAEWWQSQEKQLSPSSQKLKQIEAGLQAVTSLHTAAEELKKLDPVQCVREFKKFHNRCKDLTSYKADDLLHVDVPEKTHIIGSLKGIQEEIQNLHIKPEKSKLPKQVSETSITQRADSVTELQRSKDVHDNLVISCDTKTEAGTPLIDREASKGQQHKIMKRLKQKSLCEGDVYLVESVWYSKWEAYVTRDEDHPGPVNNSSILNDSLELVPNLVEDEDFIVLTERAWQHLITWYGQADGQEPIICPVIMQGLIKRKPCLELYPMKLELYKYDQEFVSKEVLTSSKSHTLELLKRKIKENLGLNSTENFGLFVSANNPLESKASWMDLSSMTDNCSLQEAGITDRSYIIAEIKEL